MKKVAFRVDSSVQIGSGHLMRCLTLAKRMKGIAEVTFICRELFGNLSFLVEKEGFKLTILSGDMQTESLAGYEKWLGVPIKTDAQQTKQILMQGNFDCLVVDHYALDVYWEKEVRAFVHKILVIDDLANRHHECDVLLDYNFVVDFSARYNNLVPETCEKFLGPEYVLLGDDFYRFKESSCLDDFYDGQIRNLLIFFGSSDVKNETMKALEAIVSLDSRNFSINVVVGESNINKKVIETFCRQNPNVYFHCQISNMAEMILTSDLAIGAGGVSIWERCFLGTPSIVVAVAENQLGSCKACSAVGCIDYLGLDENVPSASYKDRVVWYLEHPDDLKKIRSVGMSLFENYSLGKAALMTSILD